MRLFIAVELTEEIKKKISELVEDLKKEVAGVSWVEGKNLHLTLKFLGEVEEEKVGKVTALLNEAAQGRGGIKARFEGLGTFPAGRSPRIIWVGMSEGSSELAGLAEEIEKRFSGAGFRKEEKRFASHVTIGRIKEAGNIKEKLSGSVKAVFGEELIGAVALMKSTLSPKGPVYEKLKEVAL